jgi:hypothetical protein
MRGGEPEGTASIDLAAKDRQCYGLRIEPLTQNILSANERML